MSITSILDQNKLCWLGHVMRMGDDTIPKRMLYGRLACGSSKQGNHLAYFKSGRKALRSCNLYYPHLEDNTSRRTEWPRIIKSGVLKTDEDYRYGLKVKYMQCSMLRHANQLLHCNISPALPFFSLTFFLPLSFLVFFPFYCIFFVYPLFSIYPLFIHYWLLFYIHILFYRTLFNRGHCAQHGRPQWHTVVKWKSTALKERVWLTLASLTSLKSIP